MSGAHVRDAFSRYDVNRLPLKRLCYVPMTACFLGVQYM